MDTAVVRELIARVRDLADATEDLLNGADGQSDDGDPNAVEEPKEPGVFDPTSDTPPFPPDWDGARRAKDMALVILFGSLYAINVREGRGATRREMREIAQAASYSDARAWNGWAKYATERDASGELWVNEMGHRVWLTEKADAQRLTLPDDLAVWQEPKWKNEG